MNPADQIIPRLWLGNVHAAQDRHALAARRVNVIVNCTKNIPFVPAVPYKYRVRIDDDLSRREIDNMARALPQILPIIHAHWLAGDTILVHCAMGAQRSAIIVMAYLCQYHGLSPREAYMLIRSKRPVAFFTGINFSDSLSDFLGNY